MTDETNYRRDPEGRLIRDKDTLQRYIQHCVAELVELEKKTDPEGGADTAQGKDTKAYKAILIAAGMVVELTEWAIDHQSGLAVEGLGYAPRLNTHDVTIDVLGEVRTIIAHPAYGEALDMVDAHRHEAAGATDLWEALLGDQDNVDPVVARTILVNLLRPLAAGMDRFFAGYLLNRLADSLQRLNDGEQTTLMEPRKTPVDAIVRGSFPHDSAYYSVRNDQTQPDTTQQSEVQPDGTNSALDRLSLLA